jgi:hypothetical protein
MGDNPTDRWAAQATERLLLGWQADALAYTQNSSHQFSNFGSALELAFTQATASGDLNLLVALVRQLTMLAHVGLSHIADQRGAPTENVIRMFASIGGKSESELTLIDAVMKLIEQQNRPG